MKKIYTSLHFKKYKKGDPKFIYLLKKNKLKYFKIRKIAII